MTANPQTMTVLRSIADLAALEGDIEAGLASQQDIVAAHPDAAAVQRFHGMAQGQRYVLNEHRLPSSSRLCPRQNRTALSISES
jgi:hypothetical protein